MKKFNKLALAVLATVAISGSAFAGTVMLKGNAEDAQGIGAEFRLGVVAKIKGTVELDLINDGFADATILNTEVVSQQFAFGQKDALSTETLEAEKYSIDSNSATLQAHTCVSSEDESIQRLTEYVSINSPADIGTCVLSDPGVTNKISASFVADYAVRSSGGLSARLVVDTLENGLDSDYSTTNVDKAFISAQVADLSHALDLLLGASVGSGGDIDQGDVGAIEYSLEFDISGVASQAESRVVFGHILQIQ